MRYGLVIVLTVGTVLVMIAACSAQGLVYGPWQVEAPELEATTSWLGFTGLVYTPTALLSPPQQISGFAHQVKVDDNDRRIYGATVGLTSALEVGAARVTKVRQPTAEITYATETVVNFKYQANLGGLFNNPMMPKMVIGTYDISDQINRVNYIVLSQSLGLAGETVSPLPEMNAHIGYGNAERSGGPLDGIFGGIDFIPFQHALVQLEHDGEDINGVLRYFPAPWLSLDAGIVASEFAWGLSIDSGF